MWRPPINFVSLHYTYIILLGLLSFPILYPDGTLSAVDTYHFGVSATTESGLNTVDLKELKTYQQLYLYFLPTVTNIGFINIIVVIVRLWWFRKHLKKEPQIYFQPEEIQILAREQEMSKPLDAFPSLHHRRALLHLRSQEFLVSLQHKMKV
uniref:Uncharacterized protein n=1 Tax=Bionectria ochroleuca TaxID=29856 RepID=A0A8H7KDY5_BIOOC